MENNIKALAVSRETVLAMALTGVAILAPLFHSQLVTGTIVNATLFAAVMLLGFRAAVAVALIPSLIAIVAGTLPLAMAAMIPYIMVSNVALAGFFSLLRGINYWAAAFVASLAKFAILSAAASIILKALTQGSILLALTSMMGWPQLITAGLGAIVAWTICERKFLRKV